jgi:lincosamide nucleotidyltransferase A/C/D/E
MTAADVLEILEWLGTAGTDVWLDGGWGVDALVGEQTREHRDLDLIVRDAHESRMREVLAAHGFTQVDEDFVGNFILADGRGREVDVHPVRFDDAGNGHLLSGDGEPFGHSTEAFAATGSVSGYRVACLSAEAQMSNHSWGYEPGETDVHDMRLLHDRLGTSLIGPYSAHLVDDRCGGRGSRPRESSPRGRWPGQAFLARPAGTNQHATQEED